MPEQLASLLKTVTIQLIIASQEYINAPGKLWDQAKPQLIANLCAVGKLRETYVGLSRCVPDPNGKHSVL